MDKLIVLIRHIAMCKMITGFHIKLRTNMTDSDPEFGEAVDKEFWNLIYRERQ